MLGTRTVVGDCVETAPGRSLVVNYQRLRIRGVNLHLLRVVQPRDALTIGRILDGGSRDAHICRKNRRAGAAPRAIAPRAAALRQHEWAGLPVPRDEQSRGL